MEIFYSDSYKKITSKPQTSRILRHEQETKPKNPWGRKRADIQTKGIENVFNAIIAENFPNIGKDKDIQV
jgi:hypothetical protein